MRVIGLASIRYAGRLIALIFFSFRHWPSPGDSESGVFEVPPRQVVLGGGWVSAALETVAGVRGSPRIGGGFGAMEVMAAMDAWSLCSGPRGRRRIHGGAISDQSERDHGRSVRRPPTFVKPSR